MHILSTKQFLEHESLENIFKEAALFEAQDKENKIEPVLTGKVLATLFYEPSTRTRFSFEAGMLKLGGQVVSTESAGQFSSAIKGEALEDSIRVISGFVDAIVLRHPEQGAAKRASRVSDVPVINGGDGIGEHPTQAIYDLYTIQKEMGRIEGLHITFVGDLKNGRTIKSLLTLLATYKEVTVSLVSPLALKLPQENKEYLQEKGVSFEETSNLAKTIKKADVLYVTRIQKERFDSVEEYEELKDSYIIDTKVLSEMKTRSIIMHPLPRVNEIAPEVDDDHRSAYFRQAKNGLYVRMAILKMVLGS